MDPQDSNLNSHAHAGHFINNASSSSSSSGNGNAHQLASIHDPDHEQLFYLPSEAEITTHASLPVISGESAAPASAVLKKKFNKVKSVSVDAVINASSESQTPAAPLEVCFHVSTDVSFRI